MLYILWLCTSFAEIKGVHSPLELSFFAPKKRIFLKSIKTASITQRNAYDQDDEMSAIYSRREVELDEAGITDG